MKTVSKNTTFISAHYDSFEETLNCFERNNVDDLFEHLKEDFVANSEVLFYEPAMEFLSEYDPSLTE